MSKQWKTNEVLPIPTEILRLEDQRQRLDWNIALHILDVYEFGEKVLLKGNLNEGGAAIVLHLQQQFGRCARKGDRLGMFAQQLDRPYEGLQSIRCDCQLHDDDDDGDVYE